MGVLVGCYVRAASVSTEAAPARMAIADSQRILTWPLTVGMCCCAVDSYINRNQDVMNSVVAGNNHTQPKGCPDSVYVWHYMPLAWYGVVW